MLQVETLKPCPFCGGRADTTDNTILGFSVFCLEGCGAMIADKGMTPEQILIAWDARTPITALEKDKL